jgi:hypothetical protein
MASRSRTMRAAGVCGNSFNSTGSSVSRCVANTSRTFTADGSAQIWAQGSTEYREVLAAVAQHVADIGALGIELARAGDALWFCFGFGAWRALVRECGWSFDDAEAWLCQQAIRMLGGH